MLHDCFLITSAADQNFDQTQEKMTFSLFIFVMTQSNDNIYQPWLESKAMD